MEQIIPFGAIIGVVLAVAGFFIKRLIGEFDKLRVEQSHEIGDLAKRIGEFAQAQAIMNERVLQLLKIDEKHSLQMIKNEEIHVQIEKKIMQLEEHEKFSRKRFHELGNYVNRLVGFMIKSGMNVDDFFNGESWKF